MAKLQLALDCIGMEEAVDLVRSLEEEIDILEAGTPFLMENGVQALKTLRAAFPGKILLADSKIMDAGSYEAASFFSAGADIVTVLGVTDDQTILDCLDAAKRCGGDVLVDMLCVPDLERRAVELMALGAKKIAVHTGVDAQKLGRTPLGDLKILAGCVSGAEIFVAGGLTPETAPDYLAYNPAVLIVGSYVLGARDRVQAAQRMQEVIQRGGNQ